MISDVNASGGAAEGACRTKAGKMTLTNHKTAFNALRDLPEEHVEALKAQGYNELSHLCRIMIKKYTTLHNFWSCRFDKNNGVVSYNRIIMLQAIGAEISACGFAII